MKFYSVLAKKRFAAEKTEFVLLAVTIAISTAVLLLTLSMSTNYLTFLVKNSQSITGGSFSQLLKNNFENLSDIGEYTGEFLNYLRTGASDNVAEKVSPKPNSSLSINGYFQNLAEESAPLLPPQAENSESIFSPTASVENMPSTIFLLSVVVLFMINTTISIVFRLCRKARRSFLITMLGSGDTMNGIKKYVHKETQYILITGVPAGILLGVIGIYTVRFFGRIYFQSQSFSPFPVNIRISLSALAVTIMIIALLTFRFSKKAYKNVSIKGVASALKTKLTSDNGIRTMTAKPEKYLKKSMAHFVSIGNFSSNIMNYIGMISSTSITLLIFVIIIMVFDIVRNYGGKEILSYSSQMIEFSFASEIYFFAVASALIAVSVLTVFSSVFANITSNTGIYALMRSSGSNVDEVLRTVRKEGNITSLTCCVVASFVTMFITVNTSAMYENDSRVIFSGSWKILLVVASAILLMYTSVFVTTYFMRKKIKRLDMIGTLKNLFY